MRALDYASLAVLLVLLVGCSSEELGARGSTGGSSGEGGAGGAVDNLPGAKPACLAEPAGGPTPEARADAAAALASDDRSLVVFGGDTALPICGQSPKRSHTGETWLLDTACGGWTLVEGTGPSARARHAMASDAARNRALMFGGRTRSGATGPYELFADVWTFDFATASWSALTTTGETPSPRFNASIVVSGDTLYVFGGSTSPDALNFAPSDELFALDLTTNVWSLVDADGTAPSPRLFHAMAADTSGTSLFVFGGGDEQAFTGPFFADAYRFDLAAGTWSAIEASLEAVADPGRIKLGLLARPTESGSALYFVGGHDDGVLGNRNDVAALDPGADAWRLARGGDTFQAPAQGACDFPADFTAVDLESPERRSAFAFAPLSSGLGFIVFGGDSDCGRLNDAWWFDAVHETWTPIRTTPVGLVCPRTGNPSCAGLCG
jgi:hypothetical protein